MVDVTNASLGRHPRTLRAISEEVGVNIAPGAGLYRHQYFDAAWVDRTSTDAMAEWIARDLIVGIADTGIRAGIIGEMYHEALARRGAYGSSTRFRRGGGYLSCAQCFG